MSDPRSECAVDIEIRSRLFPWPRSHPVGNGAMLEHQDYLSAYYRDDCLRVEPRHGTGGTTVAGERRRPFSGDVRITATLTHREGLRIPNSATGMQAIPAAGVAMGVQYREQQGLFTTVKERRLWWFVPLAMRPSWRASK